MKKNRAIIFDEASKKIFSLALKVARTDATVFIMGESGTGKEILARYIHDNSPRKYQVFLGVNCAAIPKDMLEATLFGYEKGAFTGAVRAYPGKFEQAQNGTLLLDEITEMDLGLQAKLLRVLQEKEVERLGALEKIALNVRIIATSNRDLKTAVLQGKFREDLYYRLHVFPLQCLPLRERKGDILPLANRLLEKYVMENENVPSLSLAAENSLLAYSWPGNVRELENVIQRALILRHEDKIEVADLYLFEEERIAEKPLDFLEKNKKEEESKLIMEAVQQQDATRKEIAKMLGISERTLRYKLSDLRKQGHCV